jgi:hypothetical protein
LPISDNPSKPGSNSVLNASSRCGSVRRVVTAMHEPFHHQLDPECACSACMRASVHLVVRAYVRACIRMCVHSFLRAHARACVHSFLRAPCARTCVHAILRACLRGCMRACKRACVRPCVDACLYACVHACTPSCLRAWVGNGKDIIWADNTRLAVLPCRFLCPKNRRDLISLHVGERGILPPCCPLHLSLRMSK